MPIETIYIENTTGVREASFSITDQYFALPLNKIFQDELVDYAKLTPATRGDLEFICAWYSTEKVDIPSEFDR